MRLPLSSPAARTGPGSDASMHRSGMVLMVLAALTVPFGDAISKYLSAWMAPLEIGFWRFAFQAVILAAAMRLFGISYRPAIPVGVLFALAALLATTLVSLVTAFSVMPIATAIAIFFVEPLILTVFSVIFLGETAGWRRYLAVFVGLCGAIVVIRPSWSDFGWYSLLPLVTAIAFAGYATLTRRATAGMNALALQGWVSVIAAGMLGLVAVALHLTGISPATTPAVPAPLFGLLVLFGFMSATTFLMFTEAFRRTPAGILAPFQYLEIIGATFVGYAFFGDFPDAVTWIGTAIILGSGLYVFHREGRAPPAAAGEGLRRGGDREW